MAGKVQEAIPGAPKKRFMDKIIPYIMIAPAMALICAFVVYPVYKVIYWSFYDVNLLVPSKTKFVGLKNYTKVFAKSAFQKAMSNTFYYALVMVILIMVLAMLLAVWLGKKETKLNSLTQVTVFLPHVVSMVSVGLVFQQMMNPTFGVFNLVLTKLGLQPWTWLQAAKTAMTSVLVVAVWKHVGYYVLILIAALQSVPASIYEAAALDNAGEVKTFFRITLPMISPQLFFTLIVLTIGNFKVFDTIRLLTAGGPNNATTSLVYYIYRQVFNEIDIGRGCVGGVVLIVIVGILTGLYFMALSKKVHYQ